MALPVETEKVYPPLLEPGVSYAPTSRAERTLLSAKTDQRSPSCLPNFELRHLLGDTVGRPQICSQHLGQLLGWRLVLLFVLLPLLLASSALALLLIFLRLALVVVLS